MTVGNVLGEAWSLYTRFFARFFVLAAVVFLITNLAGAVLFEVIGTESTAAAGLVGLAATAVIVVGTYWLQGALVFAVQDVRDGSFDASNDEILHKVKPFLGTLVVAGLLGGLGIALGIVLLIVPGLVLLTWWALISPVIVLERKGVGEAFGRSRELVRGNGWTVFGVMVITDVAVRDRGHCPLGAARLPAGVSGAVARGDDRGRGRGSVHGDRGHADVLPARGHGRGRGTGDSDPRPGDRAPHRRARLAGGRPRDAPHARPRRSRACGSGCPCAGNRKLRKLIERANEDRQLKAWWHVSNVNAVVRLEINDHSWVHIQIVANIALKLLRS